MTLQPDRYLALIERDGRRLGEAARLVEFTGSTSRPRWATRPRIDTDLAVDGIDEVLDLMLDDDWAAVAADQWGDIDPGAGAGRTSPCALGGQGWRSTLGPDRVPLTRGDEPADPPWRATRALCCCGCGGADRMPW